MDDLKLVSVTYHQGPRKVAFCWECGKKMRGNHYALGVFSDGLKRFLHKDCAKRLSNN